MIESKECDLFDPFLDRYYSYWLHKDQYVTVIEPDKSEFECKIIGLSKSGLLRAIKLHGGEILLQPDGNSFDILQGLIRAKD